MLTTHEPGIYFGMSEEEYHADPSLSQSGMKLMKVSPLSYWDKCLNPDKPADDTTPFKEFGKAVECLLLEPERFDKEYVEELTLPEDAMVTVDDLKTWLEESGAEYKKSAAKAVLIQTVLTLDPDAPIADKMKEEFNNEHAGKKIIGRDTMREINRVVAAIRSHKDGYHVTEGGVPQVSIFWREGDVPMKARLDYPKVNYTTDLKTFSNSAKKPVARLIEEITSRDYLLQAYVSTRGIAAVVEGVNAGRYGVFGTCPVEGWLDKLLHSDTSQRGFCFAFVESDRPYNIGFKTIDAGTAYWTHIEAMFFDYLTKWRHGMDEFGLTKEWRFDEGTTSLTDDQVPVYVFNQIGGLPSGEIKE